jgi:hypothetical protein
MTANIPEVRPQHYLRSPAVGGAALKKLSLTYPYHVKWIHQEQKLNDRTIGEEDYPIQPNSLAPEFWPERGPVFWLPEFEAPKQQFRLWQNPLGSLPGYLSETLSYTYSYLVHPFTVEYFLNRGLTGARWKEPRFLATPLASHRSLLVWDPRGNRPPFAVKVSLNRWIGGLNRNLRQKEIRRSVGISTLLAGIPQTALARQGIRLLDDPIGLLPRQTNAGLLVREIPENLGRGEEIVPVFSLLASRAGGRPRIVELVAASGLEPTAWVDEFILRPLIYQAYFLGLTEGLIGEMHEQNILMELRQGLPTKRFWHRDLGGFLVDRDLRRLAGKGFERLPAHIHQRHLGNDAAVFHQVLRSYLPGSMGFAIAAALRKHFTVPADNFTGLYDARASQLQNLIFTAWGCSTTKNFEKDLKRYRMRKRPGFTWPWETLEAALRDW